MRRNVFLVTSRAKGEHEEAQITKSSERPLQKHFNAETKNIKHTESLLPSVRKQTEADIRSSKTKPNSDLGPKQSASETRELYDLVKNLFFNPTPGIGVLNTVKRLLATAAG